MRSFIFLLSSFAACALAGTSKFTLDLTWGTGAPDGFEREMIFVNGKSPGPVLDIKQDDWVEITVNNNMPFNGTIHAHGTQDFRFSSR